MQKATRSRLTVLCVGAGALMMAYGLMMMVKPEDAAKRGKPARIIDVHEHIKSINEAPKLLEVMDALGIEKTCLMGSSDFTLTLNPSIGFTGHDKNNEQLIAICDKYPGRFEAWPCINPEDPAKLEKLQNLVTRGAKGLKLYVGHGYVNPKTKKYLFHTVAIDDPSLYPVYEFCEKNFIPVCLHVNPSPKSTPGFVEEFISVLEKFPDMKVVCPHYMLSTIKSVRLEELLDCFPNLYSDISFGHDTFLFDGLDRISKAPEKFRKIFRKYPNRFMFSTDLVVTDEQVKTRPWIEDRMRMYIQMLTQRTYTNSVRPGLTLNGVALEQNLLDNILYKNYEAFMNLKPSGTQVKKVNWTRIGHTPVDRQPGQTFPPPQKGASSYD